MLYVRGTLVHAAYCALLGEELEPAFSSTRHFSGKFLGLGG